MASPPESLHDKIRTVLDETRMLILGGQVLLSFQFHGVFAEAFDGLPLHARVAGGAALALMLIATCLMIAHPPLTASR